MGNSNNKGREIMTFDRENSRAVLLISEQSRTAGFRDKRSGNFRAVCRISTPLDVDEFMDAYNVSVLTIECIPEPCAEEAAA
jgi:hypothetical protein